MLSVVRALVGEKESVFADFVNANCEAFGRGSRSIGPEGVPVVTYKAILNLRYRIVVHALLCHPGQKTSCKTVLCSQFLPRFKTGCICIQSRHSGDALVT